MMFRDERGETSGGVVSRVDARRCASLGAPAGRAVDTPTGGARASGLPGRVATASETSSAETLPGAVSGVATEAAGHVAAIRRHVAALAGADWWKTGDTELLDSIRAVEAAARSIYGVQIRLAAEMDERGLAAMPLSLGFG